MAKSLKKLVVVESPFRGKGYHETEINILYAKACVRDCLTRGEYPYASHLFYTQDGILNDRDEKERNLGIDAGIAWASKGDKRVVYIDRGISEGMKKGIETAKKQGIPVEERNLPNYEEFLKNAEKIVYGKEYRFKHF